MEGIDVNIEENNPQEIIEVSVDENAAQTAIDAAALAQQTLEQVQDALASFNIVNTIFVNNSFTKVGQIFKGNAGTQWNINGLNYTNPTDQEITIPLCATGKVRTDRIVLDTNNNFVRVQGVEFTANPVAQSKPVNTIDYTFIPVNDSEVGEPDTPTVGNIFNKKDYDKVYTFNASGANVEIPFNVSGFSTIELTGSLTSVKGFSFTDLDANPTLAEWPHKGKPIYLINRSGHNIELKHNNLTAILPFNFDSGSSIIFPNNGKILLKVMTNNVIDFFKSWGDTSEKLDKVSTVDVEKVYVKNADGTQGMKPVSDFGGGSERIYTTVKFHTGIRFYNLNTWRSVSQSTDVPSVYENGTGSVPNSAFYTLAEMIAIPDGYIVEDIEIHIPAKLNGGSSGHLEIYISRSENDFEDIDSYVFNTLVICQQVLDMAAGAGSPKYFKKLTVNSHSLPSLDKSFLQFAFRDTTIADIRYNLNFNITFLKV